MRERFEQIYSTNEWEHGSGEGSLPEHTRGYIAFLQRFIKENAIRSIVDMGCGDWQFSRYIDWAGTHYDGFDIVRSVIDNNQKRFSGNNIHFHLYNGDPADLPQADLLIAKDVLQHWSDEAIRHFIPLLQRYPMALITNCVNPSGATGNHDIDDGGFRYLDLRRPPFNMHAEEVYAFSNRRNLINRLLRKPRWHKKVLLFRHA